jgi:hypothetical protein
MRRTISPSGRYRSQEVSPGVLFESFYTGGKQGPNREVLADVPGGQTWSDMLLLGSRDDAFQMLVPDIRMPPNQYWPLHWHDCWTVVLILEGQCCIGDWWMSPGDVFITVPSLEYGPLVSGPQGVRLFEIFGKAHLAPGGYAAEYRDHPTLQGTNAAFFERSALNIRNAGRQILPCEGVAGVTKTHLTDGMLLNLGDSDDPDRGMLKVTQLAAGTRLPAHQYDDWHAALILDGMLQIGGRSLQRDDYLTIRPGSRVDEIQVGTKGAQLLELARTEKGMARRPL